MVMVNGWSGDLDEDLGRIARVVIGRGEIRVLRGGYRVAVGLPENQEAAREVLDFYHPHRLKGRVFRLAAMALVRSGLYRRMRPSHRGVPDGPEVEWLREAADGGRVGFVGCNPSHGLRCIVGGVDGSADAAPFVGKLGFDGGREAIIREADVLERLGEKYSGVLKPLSLDTGADWALMRLPHLGFRAPGDMEDPAVMELLRAWLGEEWKPLGQFAWAGDLLRRAEECGIDSEWCEAMRCREVRAALVHGDFAVWNLRLLDTGPCAFDLEWAVEEGVAGIDLAYGLRQEALLVRRLKPGPAVRRILAQVRSEAMENYLEAAGWSDAPEDWLKLGLLYAHFNANSDSSDMLAVLGMGRAGL